MQRRGVTHGRSRRDRGLPARRQLRRVPRAGAARDRHRAGDHLHRARRRSWPSPAASPLLERAPAAAPSCSTSAAARPRSAGSRLRRAPSARAHRLAFDADRRGHPGRATSAAAQRADANLRAHGREVQRHSGAPSPPRHGIARPRSRAGTVQMLGTSGTVTTLGRHPSGLPRYDRSVVDGSLSRFRRDVERSAAALAATDLRRARGQSLHRPRPGRSRGRRLRHPRRDLPALAGRAGCGSPIAACARASCTSLMTAHRRRPRRRRRRERRMQPIRVGQAAAAGRGGAGGGRYRGSGLSGRGLTVRVEDRDQAQALLDPLARAPAQRSLRRRGEEAAAIARAPPSSCCSSTSASIC